jgi:hypothetical protein
MGLSPTIPHIPVVRESTADHELVHMVQAAACNIFIRFRAHCLQPLSAGYVAFCLYKFLVVELHAWLFGSTALSCILLGPIVVGTVWIIRGGIG